MGDLCHSYIGAPGTTELYGKHAREFGTSGSSLYGPGYINREDKKAPGHKPRDPKKAEKTEKKVCPAEKARMMKEGPTNDPYSFLGSPMDPFGENAFGEVTGNCHSWANGETD